MKKILIVVFMLLGATILSFPSNAEIDPATIVAFWSFDDGAGKTVTDDSGNGLDADFFGNPKWVDGKVNKALEFNGADDYVEASAMKTPTTGTFACWFRKTGAGSGGVPRLHTSGGSPWALEFGVGNTHQPNQLEFYYEFTDGSSTGWTAFFEPEEGVWYHTAISYDGTLVTAYVDGEEMYSSDQWAGKEINQTISRMGGGALGDAFEGDIDEAILLNVAISEDDAVSLMTGSWAAVEPSGKAASTWGRVKKALQ